MARCLVRRARRALDRVDDAVERVANANLVRRRRGRRQRRAPPSTTKCSARSMAMMRSTIRSRSALPRSGSSISSRGGSVARVGSTGGGSGSHESQRTQRYQRTPSVSRATTRVLGPQLGRVGADQLVAADAAGEQLPVKARPKAARLQRSRRTAHRWDARREPWERVRRAAECSSSAAASPAPTSRGCSASAARRSSATRTSCSTRRSCPRRRPARSSRATSSCRCGVMCPHAELVLGDATAVDFDGTHGVDRRHDRRRPARALARARRRARRGPADRAGAGTRRARPRLQGSLPDAIDLRNHVLQRLDAADAEPDEASAVRSSRSSSSAPATRASRRSPSSPISSTTRSATTRVSARRHAALGARRRGAEDPAGDPAPARRLRGPRARSSAASRSTSATTLASVDGDDGRLSATARGSRPTRSSGRPG